MTRGIDTGGVVHVQHRRLGSLAGGRRTGRPAAQRDVAVCWVGLPRMKRDTFDARMMLISGVVEARMGAGRAVYQTWADLEREGVEAYLPTDGGRRV
jgi:hypothetical protein